MTRENKKVVGDRNNKNVCCCDRKKGKNNEKKLYRCQECGLEFKKKELAEKCQNWCKENKSCNLEITKYSIRKEE